MRPALTVEWWKVRRSRVTGIATALMVFLLPAMGLGFFEVANSDAGGTLGLKAQALLLGDGWVGYLGLVGQISAVAVFLGVGVVSAWMFGREFVEQTFPGLFARVVSRQKIALAKHLVVTVWIGILVAGLVMVATLLGFVTGVGTWDNAATEAVIRLLAVATLAGLLGLTMGYAATLGKGYLAAIGVLLVVVAAAQVLVLFGIGGWFPFAVPGLLAVSGSETGIDVTTIQLLLVPLIVLLTTWLTVGWWERSELV